MAQKAHPNSLRPVEPQYKGVSLWDEPKTHYVMSLIQTTIKACCKKTNHYIDDLKVKRIHGYIRIDLKLIQFHPKSTSRFKSRRLEENIVKKRILSWRGVVVKLKSAITVINKSLGAEKVVLRIKKTKVYTRNVPRSARKAMSFYSRKYNRQKYPYARHGLQLLSQVVRNKASATVLSRFLTENIRSTQKRRRHSDFLAYVESALEALRHLKKIHGLKIQVKGRFNHRAKGRSRLWRYQMGQMAMTQLDRVIQTEYTHTPTGFGDVGLKVWICKKKIEQ